MSVPPDDVLSQFSGQPPVSNPVDGTMIQSPTTQTPQQPSPASVIPGLMNDINQLSDRQSQIIEAEQGQTQKVIQELGSAQQPQRNMDKVMNAAPIFLALAAIGGKATGLHATAMLGAVNGAVSGMLKGNEQAFEDNWKKYTDNKNKLLQMYELQKDYYDQIYKSYGQKIQNKEKAIQVARDLTNDQWNHDLKKQQLIEKGQMDQIRAWDMQQRHLDRLSQMDEQKWIAEMRVEMARISGKPPSGFRFTPDGQSLEPIPGGPKDPNATQPLSGTQKRIMQQATTSATLALRDVQNVMKLPISATTGLFGGVENKGSLSTATKAALANEMNPEENQMYATSMAGITRNLGTLESVGYAPRGSIIQQMSTLDFKPGDTNITKLQKIAQVRQIAESALSYSLADPAVQPEIKQHIGQILDQYKKAIPWTVEDVIALSQSDNPNVTVMDFAKQSNLGDSNVQTQAGGAAKASPAGPQEGQKGTSKSGRPIMFTNGHWEYADGSASPSK